MRLIGFEAAEKFISALSFAISCGPREASDAHAPSLVRARPAALSENRVWTRSLGRNYTSILACCCTNQIAKVK